MKRFALLLLVACSSDPTQVMVQVQADSFLRSQDGQLVIEVQGGEADGVLATVETLTVDPTANGDFPYVVALAPRGGDDTRRWRVIATLSGDFGEVSASASGTYDDGRVVQVDLFLTQSCIGTTCPAEQTCRPGGACTDDLVEVRTLPDYDGPMPRDAGVPRDGDPRDTGTDTNLDASVDGSFDANLDTPPLDAGLACADGFVVDTNTFEVQFTFESNLTNIVLDVDGPGRPIAVFQGVTGVGPFTWTFQVERAGPGIHTLTINADEGTDLATCMVGYDADARCGASCQAPNQCAQGIADCSSGDLVCVGLPDALPDDTACELGGSCQSGICNVNLPQIARAPGVATNRRWGETIDVAGNLVVIGSPTADRTAPNAGQVHLYNHAVPDLAMLVPMGAPALNDAFGRAVAIRGARIVASLRQSSVITFTSGPSGWSPLRTLSTIDGSRLDDWLWVEGDRVLASGRDLAGDTTLGTVFDFNGTTEDGSFRVGSTDWAERFDVQGPIAVSTASGAIHVHQRAPVWSAVSMHADPFGTGNGFASDVAIAGDTILAGAPRTLVEHPAGFRTDGTVHRYALSGATATYAGELIPRDFARSTADLYGQSIDFANPDRFVVGAPGGNYVIVWERDLDTGEWYERLRLQPTSGTVDEFGDVVAADGETVAISAVTDAAGNAGAVFVVTLP